MKQGADGRDSGAVPALRVRLPPDVALHTQVRPAATAHYLLLAAAGYDSGSLQPGVVEALNEAMPIAGRRALSRVATREKFYPDAMVPDIADSPTWVRDYAAAVGDADPDAVSNTLSSRYDHRPPTVWQPVVDHPARWLQTVAATITAVEPMLSRVWSTARARLEAENAHTERILQATGTSVLLNHISTEMTFSGDELRIAHRQDIEYPMCGALKLVPMFAGPSAYLLYRAENDTHLAYAARGTVSAQQYADSPRTDGDRVVALFGPPRAAILRTLAVPHTVSELASLLDSAVSTVSHHCTSLNSAGLVEAVRTGRSVWIVRTPLGTALLELMSAR